MAIGPTERELRLLFVCTGNSARSQMAEALLNFKGKGRFHAESAGAQPASGVNPYAIETLREHHIPWAGHSPRGLDGLDREPWDFVITVCDRARQECPVFPGSSNTLHWGLDDPSEVEGTDAEKLAAFQRTRVELMQRLYPFIELALRARGAAARSTPVG